MNVEMPVWEASHSDISSNISNDAHDAHNARPRLPGSFLGSGINVRRLSLGYLGHLRSLVRVPYQVGNCLFAMSKAELADSSVD